MTSRWSSGPGVSPGAITRLNTGRHPAGTEWNHDPVIKRLCQGWVRGGPGGGGSTWSLAVTKQTGFAGGVNIADPLACYYRPAPESTHRADHRIPGVEGGGFCVFRVVKTCWIVPPRRRRVFFLRICSEHKSRRNSVGFVLTPAL